MLLGLSGAAAEADVELDAVSGSGHGDGGVASGAVLTAFAERVHAGTVDDGDRSMLTDAVGEGGLIDAAAVCANFAMMVRIADGTGTPLDGGTVEPSAALRTDLGLDELASRRVAEPN